MRGARKLSKPNPMGRRFKDSRDDAARERVKTMRCLIAGKRTTVQKWTGTYPKVLESFDVIHVCEGPKDAHHVVSKARGGRDDQTICLCRAAHSEAHYLGAKRFSAKWGVDLVAEIQK